MEKNTFLVCGNTVFGTGHSVDNHIVVVEVEVVNGGIHGKVIAPEAFRVKWPTILLIGSMEAWIECEGPARLLTDKEWNGLLLELSARTERVEYSQKYWLIHAREGGMSDDEIADKIAAVSDKDPNKLGFILHFLSSLPEDKQTDFAKRLMPVQ